MEVRLYTVFFPGISTMVHWQRSLDMKLHTDSTTAVSFIVLFFNTWGRKVVKRHDFEFINIRCYRVLGRYWHEQGHFLWKRNISLICKKATTDHTVIVLRSRFKLSKCLSIICIRADITWHRQIVMVTFLITTSNVKSLRYTTRPWEREKIPLLHHSHGHTHYILSQTNVTTNKPASISRVIVTCIDFSYLI